MKKTVISEINEIKKMMGLVTEQEKLNHSECLQIIPNFYFKKTTGMSTQDYDGGDLGFWNDNKIPKINDKEAYNRFIKLIKDVAEYEDGVLLHPEMIWNEDCGDVPSWDELLPYIQLVYLNSILSLSRKGEEVTVDDIPELIYQYSEMLDINTFSDEFEWADNVISNVVDIIAQHQDLSDREYDELYDNIKDEYGPELIGFDNPFDL